MFFLILKILEMLREGMSFGLFCFKDLVIVDSDGRLLNGVCGFNYSVVVWWFVVF